MARQGQPRVVLIIQARMGSTRLPGKSTLPLAGGPLAARILERVKRCRSVHAIVVATTNRADDDILVELARACGCQSFRGAENDLVDRYHEAADAFGADVIVRLPGDNPVPEPAEIDRIVQFHLTGQSEFSSNLAQVYDSGYPDGIGAEVFDLSALAEVRRTVRDPHRREHPHLNFFDYRTQRAAAPGKYRIGTIQCPEEFRRPDLVLDVDTAEDYQFIAELYHYLYPRNPRFHITDIVRWYDEVHRHRRCPRPNVDLLLS